MSLRQYRATRSNPCRICGKGNQYCLNYPDGNTLCMNVSSPDSKEIDCRETGIGYLHIAASNINRPSPVPCRQKPKPKIAPLELRDRVYRALVQLTPLAHHHRDHLEQARKIPCPIFQELPDQLEQVPIHYGFGTLYEDQQERRLVAKELQLLGLPLEGVPGFYQAPDGAWTIAGYDGILVPYRTPQGLIQGFQIRTFNPKAPKYTWLSSNPEPDENGEVRYRNGTAAQTYIHYTHSNYTLDLWVTEGALKATTASLITGKAFVGLPGCRVRDVVELVETLPDIPRFILCPDADWRTNPQVRASWRNNIEALRSLGLDVRVATWDPKDGKGIDDLLINTGQEPQHFRPQLLREEATA